MIMPRPTRPSRSRAAACVPGAQRLITSIDASYHQFPDREWTAPLSAARPTRSPILRIAYPGLGQIFKCCPAAQYLRMRHDQEAVELR